MSENLSDALGEALALVSKAAPGKLSVYDANEGDGWPPRPLWCFKNEDYDSDDEDTQPLQGSVHYGGKDDAEAIAAAVNLLRQHGEAIAAVLRAVEGDAWRPIETAPKDGTAVLIAGGTYTASDYGDLDYTRGRCIAYWDVHREHWHGDEANAHDEFFTHKPTHWRPLPAAPLDAAGSAEGVSCG